jgi:hypothetical protein
MDFLLLGSQSLLPLKGEKAGSSNKKNNIKIRYLNAVENKWKLNYIPR